MSSPASKAPVTASTATDGYRGALDAYLRATNTHDFDAVRPLLHPQAVFRFSDRDCKTSLDVQRYFEDTWSTVRNETYWATEVEWRVPVPTTAIASYRYHWAGMIGGEDRSGSGRATNVFVVSGDGARWLLAHEHLSASG